MGLESVRNRLRDRQVKAGARGTISTKVCLDVGLIEELEQLEADLRIEEQIASQPTGGKTRLGAPPASTRADPEITKIKKAIEAKQAEVNDTSLRLVFRSISSTAYNRLLGLHPTADADSEANQQFLNALGSWCLYEAYEMTDGEETPLDVQEFDQETGQPKGDDGLRFDTDVAPSMAIGEWDSTTVRVLALNRQVVDIPFSATSSPRKPTSGGTSKRASASRSRRTGSPAGNR